MGILQHSHEHTRSGVILKHYLMNDARARSPKFDSIFLGCALEEVEYLSVRYDSPLMFALHGSFL